MEMTAFNEIYSKNDGVEKSDFDFLNERLSWELPEEFEHLYSQANGFGGRVNDLFVELWDIDQIISFNELYEDIICGQYIFFASSDEGYDSYAYQKEDGKIYVFPTDCGVDDIGNGKLCAENLSGLLEYWKTK